MAKRILATLAATSTLALAACGDGTVGQSWYQEAGSFLDEGGFGNPTANNTLIQNGDRSYVQNLQARFAQQVPATVNFAFDSAVLDETAKQVLRQQADWIRQFPEVRFRVYGHTDLVGSDAYNKGLGQRRARAVVNFLAAQGISRSRLDATLSLGETQPLVAGATRDRRNRRTVTEVSGFVQTHPLVMQGKYAEVVWREYTDSATEKPEGQQEIEIGGGAE